MLANLRILCPNCHAKTPTFAGRNKRAWVTSKRGDTELIDLILEGMSTREVLQTLNLVGNGANYRRVERVRGLVEYVIKQTGK